MTRDRKSRARPPRTPTAERVSKNTLIAAAATILAAVIGALMLMSHDTAVPEALKEEHVSIVDGRIAEANRTLESLIRSDVPKAAHDPPAPLGNPARGGVTMTGAPPTDTGITREQFEAVKNRAHMLRNRFEQAVWHDRWSEADELRHQIQQLYLVHGLNVRVEDIEPPGIPRREGSG